MNFDKTQQALYEYVSENKLWRNFKPISELLLLVTAFLIILNVFVSIGIGSIICSIFWYIAIVITLAKGNYKVLMIAFLLRVVYEIILFITPPINFGILLWVPIYLGFAILSFKKSGMTVNDIKSEMSIDGMKKNLNLEEAKHFDINKAMNDVKDTYKETAETMKDIMGTSKN